MQSRMTRRNFSAAMMMGAAAACCAGPALADGEAGKPGKRGMKIGCGTVVFRKVPLEEALARIRKARFEWCETQAVGPWCPHVTLGKDDPAKFAELVRSHGFKGVTGLWSAHGAILADPKSVEGVCESIRWAKAARIPIVHAGDGFKPAEMSFADALKLAGERLAQILEVAEKNGVTLAIEPHGSFSLTAEGLKALMGLSKSPRLRINYDTANVHRALAMKDLYGEKKDEAATLRDVVGKVVHVHVKDVAGSACVALGDGTVNLKGCLDVLAGAGYSGVCSLETEGDGSIDDSQRIAEKSHAFLAKALASAS